jgi:hypothetical protein
LNRFSTDLGAPWRESGARLALALESSADEERGLAMLKHLNGRFGDSGYPAFLKLMLIVAESTNAEAQRRLAAAIALGLRRGDTPSGMLPGNLLGMAPRRMLDPLEYLTVWFSQRTHRPYLSESAYRDCLERLIGLFNCSGAARQWYPLKIEADVAGIEGAFTRQTRARLSLLAEAWKNGQAPGAIAALAAESLATGKP